MLELREAVPVRDVVRLPLSPDEAPEAPARDDRLGDFSPEDDPLAVGDMLERPARKAPAPMTATAAAVVVKFDFIGI